MYLYLHQYDKEHIHITLQNEYGNNLYKYLVTVCV